MTGTYELLIELDSNFLKLKKGIQKGDSDLNERCRQLELSIMKVCGVLGYYHNEIRFESLKAEDDSQRILEKDAKRDAPGASKSK